MARRKRAAARPRKAARTRVRKEASVPPVDPEDASATPPQPVDTVASTVDSASAPADGVAESSGSTEPPSVISKTSSVTSIAGKSVVPKIVVILVDASIYFRRRCHHRHRSRHYQRGRRHCFQRRVYICYFRRHLP